MKKLKLTALAVTAALALSACGDKNLNDKVQQAASEVKNAAPAAAASDTGPKFKATQVSADVEAAVKKALHKQITDSGVEIRGIYTTAHPNLYEIVMNGNQIIYITSDYKYVIAGSMLDVAKDENLTAERMSDLSKVSFDSLPLDQAIKKVYGKGTYSIAVFSDPDCPFCKQLEQQLAGADDLTVYTFLFPLESLHPGATAKAKAIMCEADPATAYHEWMVNGKAPTAAPDCAAAQKVDENYKFGVSNGMMGTPAIIFSNGFVNSGSMSLDGIMARAMEAAGKTPPAPAAASGPSTEELESLINQVASEVKASEVKASDAKPQ